MFVLPLLSPLPLYLSSKMLQSPRRAPKIGKMPVSFTALELPGYCKRAAIPFNIWTETKQSNVWFKKKPQRTKPPQTKPPLPPASRVFCISVYTVTFKINKQHRLHSWARSCYKLGVEFHHKLLHGYNGKTPGWWALNWFGIFVVVAVCWVVVFFFCLSVVVWFRVFCEKKCKQ